MAHYDKKRNMDCRNIIQFSKFLRDLTAGKPDLQLENSDSLQEKVFK
jgi:hypothetical protein